MESRPLDQVWHGETWIKQEFEVSYSSEICYLQQLRIMSKLWTWSAIEGKQTVFRWRFVLYFRTIIYIHLITFYIYLGTSDSELASMNLKSAKWLIYMGRKKICFRWIFGGICKCSEKSCWYWKASRTRTKGKCGSMAKICQSCFSFVGEMAEKHRKEIKQAGWDVAVLLA